MRAPGPSGRRAARGARHRWAPPPRRAPAWCARRRRPWSGRRCSRPGAGTAPRPGPRRTPGRGPRDGGWRRSGHTRWYLPVGGRLMRSPATLGRDGDGSRRRETGRHGRRPDDRETRITHVTATQNPPTDHPKTASESGERRYATVNPFTGETEEEFDFTPTEAIDGIVECAHAAYQAWRQRSVEDRAAVVRRAAELMDERREELAKLITTEMGKRHEEATGELYLCSMILKYYADNGPGFLEPKPIQPLMGKGEAVVETQPIGVLLAIEPWNYPFYQVVRVAGPNLVLGNTVILKHAEITPQCAVAIEQLFTDAGAPEGVFTNTFLRIDDVEQVIADPRIQGVTLTGSERAGSAVGALAGKYLKKSVLELGGSDPFIVLDADDMAATVKAATMGRMQNTGQACTASKRLIVTEELYEPFVEGLKQAFSTFSPGDPADPSTSLAPLSSERDRKS